MKSVALFYSIIIFIALMGFAVIGSATNLITLPWLKFDRQVQMERDIIDKTYNANNALHTYHWFKEKKEDITATENKIEHARQDVMDFEISAGPRSQWTFDDKNNHAHLVSIKSGLVNYYETIVGEYNAAAKSVDKAIFKDELPTFFSIKAY